MTKQNQSSVDSEARMPTEMTSPGQQLQAARQHANLSIEHVAARLCLRLSVIEAIEADDYSSLSGMVFVRGYMRAYARLLQLDADKIIAHFNALNIEEEPAERNLWQNGAQIKQKESPVKWLILLVATCSMILMIMWWNAKRDQMINEPHPVLSEHKIPGQLEPQLSEIEKMEAHINKDTTKKKVSKHG